jgi:hypothetical protein
MSGVSPKGRNEAFTVLPLQRNDLCPFFSFRKTNMGALHNAECGNNKSKIAC